MADTSNYSDSEDSVKNTPEYYSEEDDTSESDVSKIEEPEEPEIRVKYVIVPRKKMTVNTVYNNIKKYYDKLISKKIHSISNLYSFEKEVIYLFDNNGFDSNMCYMLTMFFSTLNYSNFENDILFHIIDNSDINSSNIDTYLIYIGENDTVDNKITNIILLYE